MGKFKIPRFVKNKLKIHRDANMDNASILEIGKSVKIKRTDGRVHSAVVASINYDLLCATVEWFEQGETRGKEVDLTTIKSLNPLCVIPKPHEKSADNVSTYKLNNATSFKMLMNSTRKTANGRFKSAQQQTRMSNSMWENSVTTSRISMKNSRRDVEKLKKMKEDKKLKQLGNPHWELQEMIQKYRNGLDFKPLTGNDCIEDHLITVCVRKRPLNKKELSMKEIDVITVPSKNQVIVHEPKNKVDLTKYLDNQMFRFDYAFDENCNNEIVYKYSTQSLIKTIFDGGFATCFAYGQTGSGKTHTMGGDAKNGIRGIYAMVSADIFRLTNSSKYRQFNLLVSSSFFEIYSGKVYDLLNNKSKLRILEDGRQQVQIVGLTEKVVHSTDEVLTLIHKGNQARTSGQTFANSNSSRSHAIFQIYLRSSGGQKIRGKFSLIDLAGNERGADTSTSDKQTRIEGSEINKSLLALKECIRALGRKGAHLPFRGSKLTQVLRDSFVGVNSRTCMIAMVSPGVSSCEYTLNTLRYADRVKELEGGNLQNDSSEISDFQQTLSEYQTVEQNLIDNHKETLKSLLKTYERADKLLKMTDNNGFDQETYCKGWEELLDKSMGVLAKSKDILVDYKARLIVEGQGKKK